MENGQDNQSSKSAVPAGTTKRGTGARIREQRNAASYQPTMPFWFKHQSKLIAIILIHLLLWKLLVLVGNPPKWLGGLLLPGETVASQTLDWLFWNGLRFVVGVGMLIQVSVCIIEAAIAGRASILKMLENPQ